jgi:hypothetical protein
MAERGGFEPSVPGGLYELEFGPSLAHFGPTKSIRAGENLFAWGSALPRISLVPFVHRRAPARRSGGATRSLPTPPRA